MSMLIFTYFNLALITLSLINTQQHLSIQLPSPMQAFRFEGIDLSATNENKTSAKLWAKRDDLIHPIISGNKWRKLAEIFTHAESLPQRIISFGGGYSNHLHALAYTCHTLGIPFHAIIRGNYAEHLTPCLRDIISWHGECIWSTKFDYKRRHDADYLDTLQSQYPDALIIPEGGASLMALSGVAQSVEELTRQMQGFSQQRNLIITPVATAATLAGIIHGVAHAQNKGQLQHTDILGIAVLKPHSQESADYLVQATEQLLHSAQTPSEVIGTDPILFPSWSISLDYHTGGYAKSSTELNDFCTKFSHDNFIIEPVYSGKSFYALQDLLKNQQLDHYDNIIIYHTGGLQGIRK